MNQPFDRNTNCRLVLITLLLFGAALRFYQLDRSLGGGDENQYLLDYGDTSLKYIATTYFFGGHPVFHTLLMRLMIMGFGDENALAIRLPAFISGVACLWLVHQVALQLFGSVFIARLSLLITALCPVHVYYSQIARGYSLLMFFSIAMVYSAVKLLDSPGFKWGAVLVLCGVLSVYTVPTNVYFAVSLAVWMFAATLVPRWAKEHDGMPSGKQAAVILGLFLIMAALAFLVYLPLMDQVIAEANNYHLAHERETSRLAITGRVPTGTLALIFPGALMWFLPFLAVGMLLGDTRRPSYRLLPLCIFFLPLLAPLATGVSGYPRNYLYNLPVLVIFLAGGIARAGKFLGQCLTMRQGETILQTAIAAGYVIVSSIILVTDHYPAINMPDGKLYQQKIREYSQPLDLIAITDPRHYLYAKSVYSGNLMNIIRQNQLTGIKLIATEESLPDDKSILPFLQEVINLDKLKFQALPPGKKIFSLTGTESLSLLPEDFESLAKWKTISGKGKVSVLEDRKFAGKSSLMMEADKDQDMVIRASIDHQVQLGKATFIVLLWTKHGVKNPLSVLFQPMLTLQVNVNGAVREMQLRLEKINNGINLHFWEDSFDWAANSVVGRMPPGNYTFNMFLRCKAGESVIYDGFRIFFIEIPTDFLDPALQESMKTK